MLETRDVAGLSDRCDSLEEIIGELSGNATVLDVGCFGWRLAELTSAYGATLVGADLAEPPGRPRGARFVRIEDNAIAMPPSQCELVVAAHVLEHVMDATRFMRELVRVTSPGGLIYIEAPSELACVPRSSDDAADHSFHNFWDDPTHIRPWTPGALYRLALSCEAMPVAIERASAGGIPVARMVARKPAWVAGAGRQKYVSLRDVPRGVHNAWAAVWGDTEGEAP